MRHSKIKYYVMLTGLLLVCSSVDAQNWYIGIGAGNTTVDLSEVEDSLNSIASLANSIPGVSSSASIDDNDTGLRIFSGYNVNENFAFEFGYADLGEVKAGFSMVDDGSVSGMPGTTMLSEKDSVSGVYGALVGKLPLSDLVALQGRVGLYVWNMDSDISSMDTTGLIGSGIDSSSDNGQDGYYGVGLDIGWFGLFYDVYKVSGDDVNFIGVSATYNFQ